MDYNPLVLSGNLPFLAIISILPFSFIIFNLLLLNVAEEEKSFHLSFNYYPLSLFFVSYTFLPVCHLLTVSFYINFGCSLI